MIKEEDRKKIINFFNERVEKFDCPICHKGHFSIVDGYSNHVLTSDYHEIALEGKILPFIMLVCNNCGFVSYHALGTLSLLDNTDTATSVESPSV